MLVFQLTKPPAESERRARLGLPAVTQEEVDDLRDQIEMAKNDPDFPIVVSNLRVDVWPIYKNEDVDEVVKECAAEVFGEGFDYPSHSALKDFALKFTERYLSIKQEAVVVEACMQEGCDCALTVCSACGTKYCPNCLQAKCPGCKDGDLSEYVYPSGYKVGERIVVDGTANRKYNTHCDIWKEEGGGC